LKVEGDVQLSVNGGKWKETVSEWWKMVGNCQ